MSKVSSPPNNSRFSHEQKASISKAELLFRTFLSDFTLSETDRIRRESALLALPIHLKKAEYGKIDNVVLFPFGTFYHGLGFKDDPLTAFVSTGYPKVGEKKGKTLVNDDEDSDKDSNGSSGYYVSSNENDSSSDSDEEQETSTACARNDGRMRQTLLLDINDVLTNRDNQLSGTYKDVSLTRQAKLYYRHHHHSSSSFTSSSATTTAPTTTVDLGCLLEAKSFMPVQTSRLIKFYCLLEQLFWPFAQLVLNWARKNGVLEHAGQTDNDGLKQEHMLLLVIFFLVERRIIPSFKLLQEWSTSQMIVDEVNVGFCENVEIVRKNCQMMGIGSLEQEECVLERILQLILEFFKEMSVFNFTHEGISPSLGFSFSKFSLGQLTVHNPTNKRRLDTNSLICIQDVLDQCQNVTRKVKEDWVLKFRARCKRSANRLFSLLRNGDLLNAISSVLEDVVDATFEEMDNMEEYTTWNTGDDFGSHHTHHQSGEHFSPQSSYDNNFTHSRAVNFTHGRVVNFSSEHAAQQQISSSPSQMKNPYTNSLPIRPIMPILNKGKGASCRGRGQGRGTRGRSTVQSRNALLNKLWTKRGRRKMVPYQ